MPPSLEIPQVTTDFCKPQYIFTTNIFTTKFNN